jgi:hypothetical protein
MIYRRPFEEKLLCPRYYIGKLRHTRSRRKMMSLDKNAFAMNVISICRIRREFSLRIKRHSGEFAGFCGLETANYIVHTEVENFLEFVKRIERQET